MLVLITYDVNTETERGKKRLRKIAKVCTNYGQRVQNSVFECVMDAAKARLVKAELEKLIDKEKDSLRFYNLGTTIRIRSSILELNQVSIWKGCLLYNN